MDYINSLQHWHGIVDQVYIVIIIRSHYMDHNFCFINNIFPFLNTVDWESNNVDSLQGGETQLYNGNIIHQR